MRCRTGSSRQAWGWGAAAIVACSLFFAAAPAQAQWKASPFGIGGRIGDPSGVSIKYWLASKSALQFDVGWRAAYWRSGRGVYYPGPTLSVDWVFQIVNFAPRSPKVWFGVHIGAGGAFSFVDECYVDTLGYTYCSNALTARMPIAFNVYIRKVHIEAFAELVPGLRLTPRMRPTFAGSIGARYYF